MKRSMEEKLRELVQELVADLDAIVREAALEAAREALHREGAPAAGRARVERAARPGAAERPNPAAKRRKRRPAARGADSGMAEAVLEALRAEPGLRVEQLAAALDKPATAVRRALTALVVQERVAADGVGRGMRYRPAEVEPVVELVPTPPPARQEPSAPEEPCAVEPPAAEPPAAEPPAAEDPAEASLDPEPDSAIELPVLAPDEPR